MTNPLTKFREAQDPPMKPAELARVLEIDRSYLLRLESGERQPGPKLAKTIEQKLGIPRSKTRPDLYEAAE